MKVMNETNGPNIGVDSNARISAYISRCEKGISPIRKMKSRMQFNGSDKTLDDSISIRNAFKAKEIDLEKKLAPNNNKFGTSKMFKSISEFHPYDYLNLIEPHMPKELLSKKNYSEIKNVANYFKHNLTSFFGFETKLNSADARSDYLFAISSKKGERESLVNIIKNNHLPESFRNQPEWQQVGNFAESWANPKSVLYNNVLGMWFEFDTSGSPSEIPLPGVFIHTIPIKYNSKSSEYRWFIETAIPMLIGRHLSTKIERKIQDCIQKMPPNASLYQVGTMLPRETDNIRLVLKRMHPNQILPYLKAVGWSDDNEELSSLLKELEKQVNRIVLHISVGEQVDSKIGIECSFYPGFNDKEKGWSAFLEYLIEKGLCLSEKQSALLNFPGLQQENINNDFDLKSYMPSVMITDENFSSALVRFISHVKIVYKPNHPLDAKAYYGVRHFGSAKY